jgi:hypothetical protein
MLIQEKTLLPGAVVRVHVERAYDYDEKRGLWLYRQEDEDEVVHNVITNHGRDQLHLQCYGETSLSSCGFNYIALSNDTAAPAATDTSLAGELIEGVAPGLQRAQGSYVHGTGTNTTTITNPFTYTGTSQPVQKAALFNQPTAGIMNHEIAFTQRTLYTNDIVLLAFTITLG